MKDSPCLKFELELLRNTQKRNPNVAREACTGLLLFPAKLYFGSPKLLRKVPEHFKCVQIFQLIFGNYAITIYVDDN